MISGTPDRPCPGRPGELQVTVADAIARFERTFEVVSVGNRLRHIAILRTHRKGDRRARPEDQE
jgi:hypothetical protein